MRAVRVLVGLVLVAASCGSSGSAQSTETTSVDTTTEPPVTAEAVGSTSTTTASTTVPTEPTTEPSVEAVPVDLEGCASPVPPGFPDAEQFTLVAEEEIFRCFGVESFVFDATFESEIAAPDQLTTIDFVSSSVLANDEVRYHAEGSADGTAFEVTRVGDIVYGEEDGQSVEFDVNNPVEAIGIVGLTGTEAQFTLAGVGFVLVEMYGAGATRVGEDDISGKPAIRWEADGDSMAQTINGLGVVPGTVAVTDSLLRIWTDEHGQVLRVDATIPADGVTINGLPAAQLVEATDSGFPFGIDYHIGYSQFDEPVEIEAPSP